jgi:hypothetical protein
VWAEISGIPGERKVGLGGRQASKIEGDLLVGRRQRQGKFFWEMAENFAFETKAGARRVSINR